MTTFSKFKSLDELLKNNKYDKTIIGNKPTHTRIGNAKLNIFGGSYAIEFENSRFKNKFYKLYNRKVLKKKFKEHLTELQNKKNGGPILIDLDFKFPNTVTERIFDDGMIFDMVDTYTEEIIKLYNLDHVKSFEIYVLLKDDIVEDTMNDCIKDGIHIQVLLKTTHETQLVLRKHVMKAMCEITLNDLFDSNGSNDIELINDKEDVFDKSITSGNTGWLLYGSRKPGGEPYKLKYKYNIKQRIQGVARGGGGQAVQWLGGGLIK